MNVSHLAPVSHLRSLTTSSTRTRTHAHTCTSTQERRGAQRTCVVHAARDRVRTPGVQTHSLNGNVRCSSRACGRGTGQSPPRACLPPSRARRRARRSNIAAQRDGGGHRPALASGAYVNASLSDDRLTLLHFAYMRACFRADAANLGRRNFFVLLCVDARARV